MASGSAVASRCPWLPANGTLPASGKVGHPRRAAAGLSSQTLAARSGITASTLSRIEHGKADPSWRTVERLFGELGYVLREEETTGATDHEAA